MADRPWPGWPILSWKTFTSPAAAAPPAALAPLAVGCPPPQNSSAVPERPPTDATGSLMAAVRRKAAACLSPRSPCGPRGGAAAEMAALETFPRPCKLPMPAAPCAASSSAQRLPKCSFTGLEVLTGLPLTAFPPCTLAYATLSLGDASSIALPLSLTESCTGRCNRSTAASRDSCSSLARLPDCLRAPRDAPSSPM